MTFINQLKASPTKLLTSGQVHKASEQEHLYIIKVSDFIIPFILNGNQIEIQDIYKNERLKHIF